MQIQNGYNNQPAFGAAIRVKIPENINLEKLSTEKIINFAVKKGCVTKESMAFAIPNKEDSFNLKARHYLIADKDAKEELIEASRDYIGLGHRVNYLTQEGLELMGDQKTHFRNKITEIANRHDTKEITYPTWFESFKSKIGLNSSK